MDTTLFSNLGSMGLAVGAVATPVAFLLLALFIRWRTGSSFTVLSRLWTVFHGSGACTVPAIGRYLDAQADVARLSFATGLRLRTEEHALRLLSWRDRHEESLTDVARCGPYFDQELPGLKDQPPQPGKALSFLAFPAFVILLVAAAAMTGLAIYDKPLVQLKRSGTWLSLSTNDARPIIGPTVPFALCGKPVPDAGFGMADWHAMCTAFGTRPPAERQAYVDRLLMAQRGAGGLLAISCVFLMIPLFKVSVYAAAADSMRERLRKKALEKEKEKDAATTDGEATPAH